MMLQVTTVQHKQMFVPNRQLPSPNVGTLDGGGQFAAAPPGGFLGSKRAGAMQQAVSRQAGQLHATFFSDENGLQQTARLLEYLDRHVVAVQWHVVFWSEARKDHADTALHKLQLGTSVAFCTKTM